MGTFKLSRSSKRNLSGVKDRIKQLVNRVLTKSEFDFGIPQYGGLRTAQEQNNLFHKRPRVTWLDGFKKKSYHQSGNAFDIFIFHDGKACWDCIEKYEAVAKTVKEEFDLMKKGGIFGEDERIVWGGDWKRFKDHPHFEIR